MPVKSLQLTISDVAPFDHPEKWFESFAGRHLRPIIDSVPLKRFWFSRYGGVGSGKSVLFRFECDDEALIRPHVDRLRQTFSGESNYIDYDYASDIGKGDGSRFLGDNGRHNDKQRRGELAFDFLHASAKLFLDGLKGLDGGRYLEREPETASGFSRESSLEQYLHLFCNMTGTPSFVVEAQHPQHGNMIFSLIRFAILQQNDQRWQILRLVSSTFKRNSQECWDW